MPYRWPNKAVRRGLFLSMMLLLAACGQETPQTILEPHSESARAIYDLTVLLFWLGVAVFVIVQVWLMVSIIKYRHQYNDDLPAQIHGNTKVEIGWTIVPAIVATIIFVITFQTILKIENKPNVADEIRVEVIGHQWWWEFRYPDIQTSDGQPLITANEMWVPAGRVVSLDLTSDDVIHSFWVPGLAGKRDAMPNHITNIWFEADDVIDGAPQTFWSQCAEYCGTQHAYMKMRVIVASANDFEQWVEEQSEPAVNTDLPVSFQEAGCVGCHAIRGTSSAGITGPELTHFGSRQTIAAGTLDNTPENLYRWLDEPNVVKRGNLMSAAIKDDTLSPEQIQELVDYLLSLDPGIDAKP